MDALKEQIPFVVAEIQLDKIVLPDHSAKRIASHAKRNQLRFACSAAAAAIGSLVRQDLVYFVEVEVEPVARPIRRRVIPTWKVWPVSVAIVRSAAICSGVARKA